MEEAFGAAGEFGGAQRQLTAFLVLLQVRWGGGGRRYGPSREGREAAEPDGAGRSRLPIAVRADPGGCVSLFRVLLSLGFGQAWGGFPAGQRGGLRAEEGLRAVGVP